MDPNRADRPVYPDYFDEVENSGSGGAPLKPWDRKLNRGNSLADVRHNFVLSATYELPFGRGKIWLGSADPFTAAILGGWQFSGVFTRNTGLPFTVTSSGNITNAGGADRPNRIGDGTLPSDRRSINR